MSARRIDSASFDFDDLASDLHLFLAHFDCDSFHLECVHQVGPDLRRQMMLKVDHGLRVVLLEEVEQFFEDLELVYLFRLALEPILQLPDRVLVSLALLP